MEEVFPNKGPCEICLAFYQNYFLPLTQVEFVAHIKAKHGGIVDEDVLRSVKSDMESNTTTTAIPPKNTPASKKKPQPASAGKKTTPKPWKGDINAGIVVPSTPVFDYFGDLITPFVDPKCLSLSRPSAKTSSAEEKAKTWVVEENKEKPWNMEKVLEELGEVSTYLMKKVISY